MKLCGFNFNTSYTKLPEEFYTRLNPEKAPSPDIIIVNNDLAESLGLNFSSLSIKEQADLFSGNSMPEGSESFAQSYAGHQFGHFTILGDGRALVWGEHITPEKQRLDIQFKGSGPTPYSRGGDGRAALGPMIREYIISEAMYNLGIPTTRSLAIATTRSPVFRDTILPGAILTRIAKSHIRVGTFEFALYKRNMDSIESLLNYTIDRHYPHLSKSDNKAVEFLEAIIESQSDLIIHWMRVGFIHGVMNTDNMALSGETIDYGPCAFMDSYDPNTVFSSIDHNGRYAYSNQPKIAAWNIARLAETLLPLIDSNQDKAIDIAENIINKFEPIYKKKWLNMMKAKLGLFGNHKDDEKLISNLLNWMQQNYADYTNLFRDLSNGTKPEGSLYNSQDFDKWYNSWQNRLRLNNKNLDESIQLMKKTNPSIIPRNHIVERVIEAANNGDFDQFHKILNAIKKNPYEDDINLKYYQTPPKPTERIYQTFCGT